MVKAVIFDMDGLMIDNEPIHNQSTTQVLAEYGVNSQMLEQDHIQIIGMKEYDIWQLFKKKYSLNEDTLVLMQKRSSIYMKLIQNNIVPRLGLKEFMDTLKEHNIKMAVASSSVLPHIQLILNGLGITQYFDAIVSGQFVSRGKPFPDIFLKAAEELQVDPKDCLVLEDAQNGINAAKNAGMKAVAVPTLWTKSHDFSKADLIINSLKDLKITTLQSLN